MRKLLCFLISLVISSAAIAKTKVVTLTPANVVVLRDEVTEDSISKLAVQLEMMQGKSVYLYLYSPGGSIVAGMRLLNLLKALEERGTKVTCIADFAASMAFSIFQACSTRLMVENGVIMQHQASYSIEGPVLNNRARIKMVEDMAQKLNELDAARLQMPIAQFQAKIAHDWWLFDTQAVEAKAADEMVVVNCHTALVKMTYVDVIESIFGVATVKWSACPLIYAPLSVDIKPAFGVKPEEFNDWVDSLPIATTWKERMEVR